MADSIGSLAIKLVALTDTLKPGLKQGEQDVADWTKRVQAMSGPKIGTKGIRDGMRDLRTDYRQFQKDTSKPLVDFNKLAPKSPVDLDRVGPSRRDLVKSRRELAGPSPERAPKAAGAKRPAESGGGGLMGNVVSGIAAAATFGASKVVEDVAGRLGGMVMESIDLAANFEKMQISFETLLGSAPAATKMLKDVSDFAQETPFSFAETGGLVKNLLAYGIQAEQTIPTIRALGDVASGTGTEIGRLVMAYGQVATAGQLYGTELRQFTEAGVPIIEALADVMGKPKARIKDLIEQGKVGFPEVTKAFKKMTEEGGKFAGLTDKFGKSFGGQVEKLKDSIEIVKREFGAALIEELGLKEATQDLSKFTDKIKDVVTGARPVMRFLGELGRAGAQVGYEIGKAAVTFQTIQATTTNAAFPELGKTFEDVRKIVSDLKDFKIDPTSIENAAFRITSMTALSIAGVIDYGEEMWEKGADVADRFLAAAEEMKKVAEKINSAVNTVKEVRDFRDKAGRDPIGTAQETFGLGKKTEIPVVPKDYGKSQWEIDTDARSKFLEKQERLVVAARDRAAKSGSVPYIADNLVKDTRGEIDKWGRDDRKLGRDLYMKDVKAGMFQQFMPNYTEGPTAALMGPAAMFAKPGGSGSADSPAVSGKKGFVPKESAVQFVQRMLADADRALFKSQNERDFAKGHSLVESAASGLNAPLRYFGSTLDVVRDKLELMGKTAGKNALEITQGGIPRHLYEMADNLNKANVSPVEKFAKELRDLDRIFGEELIDWDVHALGIADAVKDLSKGLDLTKRMPNAADYGSQEFAKLATLPFQGGPDVDVASLLRAANEYHKQQLDAAWKLNEQLLDERKKAPLIVHIDP